MKIDGNGSHLRFASKEGVAVLMNVVEDRHDNEREGDILKEMAELLLRNTTDIVAERYWFFCLRCRLHHSAYR